MIWDSIPVSKREEGLPHRRRRNPTCPQMLQFRLVWGFLGGVMPTSAQELASLQPVRTECSWPFTRFRQDKRSLYATHRELGSKKGDSTAGKRIRRPRLRCYKYVKGALVLEQAV